MPTRPKPALIRQGHAARGAQRDADRIAARPARGDKAANVDDLRAIPWVFAWSQTRVNLLGWFGLCSGLAAVAEDAEGLHEAQQAYREIATGLQKTGCPGLARL